MNVPTTVLHLFVAPVFLVQVLVAAAYLWLHFELRTRKLGWAFARLPSLSTLYSVSVHVGPIGALVAVALILFCDVEAFGLKFVLANYVAITLTGRLNRIPRTTEITLTALSSAALICAIIIVTFGMR